MASPFFFVSVPGTGTLQVQVWLVGGSNVAAADFTATYDSALGSFTTATGPNSWTTSVNSTSPPTVIFGGFDNTSNSSASVAPVDDGLLATLSFNVTGDATHFTLSLSDANLADPDLNTIDATAPSPLDFTFIAVTNDTATATEAGGTANGVAGVDPTGNALINDKGTGLSITDVAAGSTKGTVGSALTGTHGSLTLGADGAYNYAVTQSDATVQALNSGQSTTDTFTYTAKNSTTNATQTATLTVTISGADDAPVASPVVAQNATVGTPLTYQVGAFSDPDNSAGQILYAATLADGSPLPSWLAFNASTIEFTGTPPVGSNGVFDVKVTGTDPATLSDSATFSLTVTCFAAGTRIATARGERRVEDLRVGDEVQTLLRGRSAQVMRLRQRRVDCARHPSPHLVWPVRVSAGAFGPGLPVRDLVLSPDHAIYSDMDAATGTRSGQPGVLIPVKYLINGTTIRREEVDRIDYYHVQLPRHDVLLAEGLTTESYLDTAGSGAFDAEGHVIQPYPDFSSRQWEAEGCAELVITGPAFDAVAQRLARHAGSDHGRATEGTANRTQRQTA